MEFKTLQQKVHSTARESGWYGGELGERSDLRIASMIALVHSELSEALEELRQGRKHLSITEEGKPGGFPSELADVVIRVMDMAEWLGIDLEQVIVIKNKYNQTRSYRHGNKKI